MGSNIVDRFLASHFEIYNSYIQKAEKYFISKTEDDATGTVTAPENNSFTADNGFSVTLAADSLAAQHSSVDKYKVNIDPASINVTNTDIYVHVRAVPTEPTNLSTIATRLYGAAISESAATWSGSFNEQNCDKVDYDFYNYIITGSGAGTVDILWDPKKFEINQFFFDTSLSGVNFVGGSSPTPITDSDTKYGNGKDNGKYVGWSKVTISVNSMTKNRYELQLYKTKSNSLSGVTYTGENAATKYIACFFN